MTFEDDPEISKASPPALLPSQFQVLWDKLASAIVQKFQMAPCKFTVVMVLCLIVVITGAIAFFIIVGAVQFSDEYTKGLWLEIQFQILTAIFTLAAVADQPNRIRGLYLALKIKSSIRKQDSIALAHYIDEAMARYAWFREPAIHLATSSDCVAVAVIDADADFNALPVNPSAVSSSDKLSVLGFTGFFLCFVSLNFSTLMQIMISTVMFGFHPWTSRPSVPISVGVPLAILTGILPGIYQAVRLHKIDR